MQVLLLAMNELPLGRRALLADLRGRASATICRSASTPAATYRHAPTPIGWPSYFLEDYVGHAQAFQSQLLSLIAEGVFQKFPELKVVMIESGFTWLPPLLWRADKTWRGVRPRGALGRPSRRRHDPPACPVHLAAVRCAAGDPKMLERVLEHIGSDDMLLFSTDYPHWHYDGDDVLPEGLAGRLVQKLLVDNPLATYSRLRDSGAADCRQGDRAMNVAVSDPKTDKATPARLASSIATSIRRSKPKTSSSVPVASAGASTTTPTAAMSRQAYTGQWPIRA